MARARIHVVGAGPNGLAAAVALASNGLDVTVREAADHIGGGTRTEALTLPGFRHDVCSTVHPMGAASPFFRTLPLAALGVDWCHPEIPLAHPFDDGSSAVLLRSLHDTAHELGRDGKAYRRLLRPFVEHGPAFFEDVLAPILHVPRHPLLLGRLGRHGMATALDLARRRFDDEHTRALFVGLAAHTLLPMTQRPSAAFGIVLAVAAHVVGWPFARGGSQSIADALATLLRRSGGRIHTDSRVRDVDSLPDGDAIVLDLTTRQVLDVAGHRLPGRYRRHLERFRYGPGVFKVDWALREPIPWTAGSCRRAGTIHLGGSALEIARSADAAAHGIHEERPAVILTQPSLFDPTRAPEGRHVAWAYCHVPNASTADMTDAIEAQVERFAPGFRETVLARSVMNSHELERHNANLVGGDINGGIQDVWQMLFRPAPRLDPYATPAEGIYLCSASTPPGGAVHGMCGWHAARSVMRRLRRV